MGKGDIKSRKGKIANGSYGSRRKKKPDPVSLASTTVEKAAKPEKPKADAAAPKRAATKKTAAKK